jgi:hypothetical protein
MEEVSGKAALIAVLIVCMTFVVAINIDGIINQINPPIDYNVVVTNCDGSQHAMVLSGCRRGSVPEVKMIYSKYRNPYKALFCGVKVDNIDASNICEVR